MTSQLKVTYKNSRIYPDTKPRYCVQISDGRWIKRTSSFGRFHGSIILTMDPNERRWWTSKVHADNAARVFEARIQTYGKYDKCRESNMKDLTAQSQEGTINL